jgi:hypothetical protein
MQAYLLYAREVVVYQDEVAQQEREQSPLQLTSNVNSRPRLKVHMKDEEAKFSTPTQISLLVFPVVIFALHRPLLFLTSCPSSSSLTTLLFIPFEPPFKPVFFIVT